MVDPDGRHVFWTVMLFTWPYACIPLAFYIDGNLRARWHLEDVSRPAAGIRFKGANLQMVFTSKVRKGGGKLAQQEQQQHVPGRSRWLDCTSLWPLAVVGPAVFVFAAEWSSSGALSELLVCTPFVFLTLLSLTLNQVTILVSLLASPVVSIIYGVINRGPGDSMVASMLWSQAFIVLTAVSLAWSVHGVCTLRKIIAADAAAAGDQTGADSDRADDGQLETPQQRQRSLAVNLPPENCIIKAAEAILSGHPGSVADEDRALAVLSTTVTQAWLRGLTMDAPVLQTAQSLHAWSKVISHQGEVERDIRETDRWGELEEKLVSMNAGMPSMVGIIQGTLLATSQLEKSDAYGSGPVGITFYYSLVAFAASIVVSTVLLVRMLTLIHRAAHGLADAAKKTDTAMETFVDLRSWGILRDGEVGCLTHVAAGKGMVRALDFLVQNGANPSSEDSAGKTPLQIAQETGMTEACSYLEAATSERTQRPSAVISSPLAEKLRKKASRGRAASSTLPEEPGDDLAGRGARGSQSSSLTSGWPHMRKVGGTVVRWVFGTPDKVLAGRATRRVGVEPRDPCAAPVIAVAPAPAAVPGGPSPSESAAEGGALLPPALAISLHEQDSEMVASGIPSASSLRPSSPVNVIDQSEHGDERGAMVAAAGAMVASGHNNLTRAGGDGAARRDGRAGGGAESAKDGERVGEGAGTAAGENSGAGTSARYDGDRHGRAGDDDGGGSASSTGGADKAKSVAERALSPARPRSSVSRRLSATFSGRIRRAFSDDDGTAGTGGALASLSASLIASASPIASASGKSPRSALRRSLSYVRAMSAINAAGAAGTTTYSPTQAVLNITWALRRLRPLGTPRERRMAFKDLRESSPIGIPQMFLLAFADLAALGEIPRRTGDRFLGKADKRPLTVCDLMARAAESGEDPLVVYVSHRWLEPDFKNPDDHSKSRFYQVCYAVQKLAKRTGRKPCEFYLWIDYACINQQNPTADRLALPCVLDSCDFMVYVEDDEYWDQALSRTEHFLFNKLRRLRPPANGAIAYDEDVFSLSADGERLTQRTYSENRARFTHNPAKGSLTTETDRLYLWTLVLALEFEDTYTFRPNLAAPGGTGFIRLLHDAILVRNGNGVAPKEAAGEETVTTRDAQGSTGAAAADDSAGAAIRGDAQGRRREGGGGIEEEKRQEGGEGDADVYGSDGNRAEVEVDGGGSTGGDAGHREGGGGGGGGVSRSGSGGPIRGGFGSGDQAYRDHGTSSGAWNKSRSDDMLRSSASDDDVGGNLVEDGVISVGRVRANSGGDGGDIETGAGGDVL